MIRTRLVPLVLGATLLVAGCSLVGDDASTTATTAPPDVVAYWGETGETEPVAQCIGELGRRNFSPEELLAAADGRALDPETDAQLSELVASCRLAHADATAIEPDLQIVGNEPTKFGDDAHLDQLYVACGNGVGASCDQLFDDAPVGSEYEEYGLTCGNRPDLVDCAELDVPEGPAPSDD